MLAVAVDGDVLVLVDDRQLDELVGAGGFLGVRVLVFLGAVEEVAAGHPAFGRQFAENDAVESAVEMVDRQGRSALLVEVGRRGPDDEGLVADFGLLGRGGGEQGEEENGGKERADWWHENLGFAWYFKGQRVLLWHC